MSDIIEAFDETFKDLPFDGARERHEELGTFSLGWRARDAEIDTFRSSLAASEKALAEAKGLLKDTKNMLESIMDSDITCPVCQMFKNHAANCSASRVVKSAEIWMSQ